MLELLIDKSPCDGCPATTTVMRMQKCIEMGACWMVEPDLLTRVLLEMGVTVGKLHEPPTFVVKTTEVGEVVRCGGFDVKQPLNETGRIVKGLYALRVDALRRERLRVIELEGR